jgi:hypothetical protein
MLYAALVPVADAHHVAFPAKSPGRIDPLIDPVSNLFYGGPHVFMTKDLFYSGHTSTQFMIFLCFTKKWDKRMALFSSVRGRHIGACTARALYIDVVGAFCLLISFTC